MICYTCIYSHCNTWQPLAQPSPRTLPVQYNYNVA